MGLMQVGGSEQSSPRPQGAETEAVGRGGEAETSFTAQV